MQATKSTILSLSAAALLATPAAAPAWWFDSKKDDKSAPTESQPGERKMLRQYLLHVPDKKTEKELLSLFDSQRRLNEDLRVLNRVYEERKDQYGAIQKGLMDDFGVLPETRYHYDDAKMTLFEIAPRVRTVAVQTNAAAVAKEPAGEAGDPPAGFEQKKHREIKTKDEERRLVGLINSKKRIHDELRALQILIGEKQQSLKNVSDLLNSKFSLKPGRFYDYDPKTMKLYELTPADRQGASEPPPAR